MSPAEPPPLSAPPRPPADQLFVGCLMGCAVQVSFLIVGIIAAATAGDAMHGKLSPILGLSWGLTQWIALVPLIRQQRAQGYRNRVTGMIIAGSVGLLLSSACGATLIR